MKKALILAATLGLISHVASAGEVGTTSTFQSGTPALASEVNGNFDALIAAINDNASRIAALEAANAAAPDDSVAGHTYSIQTLNTDLSVGVGTGQTYNSGAPNQNGFANIGHGSFQTTIAFASTGGTFTETFAASSDKEYEVNLPNYQYTDWTDAQGGVTNGTYQQNGNVLTLTFPGDPGEPDEQVTLIVSEDGSFVSGVLVEQGQDDFEGNGSGESSFIELILGVRSPAG